MVDPARVRKLLESPAYYRDHLVELRDVPVDRYVTEHGLAISMVSPGSSPGS